MSELCLGTMMFGSQGNSDQADCVKIIHRALDSGINFIDTADVYSFGESEEIVGRALVGQRERAVLATKVGLPMSSDLNTGGNSRLWVRAAVERSMRRLGTDYIDLLQIHALDPLTDLADLLMTLDDLVRNGIVRMAGCCNFPAHELVSSALISRERRGYGFQTYQPPYSIFARGAERDAFDVARNLGMGVLTWSPLNSGWLTGRYRRGTSNEPSPRSAIPVARPRDEADRYRDRPQRTYSVIHDYDAPQNQAKLDAVEQLLALADSQGTQLTAMALGFVLEHPAVTCAIVGPRTGDQLEGLLRDYETGVSTECLDEIDRIVPPGTNLALADGGYIAPGLIDKTARRRRGGT